MDMSLKEKFLKLWKKYFNNAELPITFYYANAPGNADTAKPTKGHRCVISDLAKVRRGQSLALDVDSVGCPGGKRYLGFAADIMPDFEYFLSCGIPGRLEGERYKKTPEMVREYMENHAPALKVPGKYIVFKRWDKLDKADDPEIVICFARPDALAGLFTLASFDEAEQNMVIAPFGSGCASIVQYPYLEKDSQHPRGVLGMFDISARPFVPEDMLTFAAPMSKFVRMIDNMEESFLITPSWARVQQRIK
jgi:uncharacterized protein (DUF169 family)